VGAVILWDIRVTGPGGEPQAAFEWLYQHTTVLLAGDTAAGSFLFAAGFMLVNWLFTWACYRRGVILKV
jgi:predicted acyltransferase